MKRIACGLALCLLLTDVSISDAMSSRSLEARPTTRLISQRGLASVTVTNGLRMTTWVPKTSYPIGAMVPVRVRVTNVSRTGKLFGRGEGDCPPNIRVQVLSADGKPVYQVPFTDLQSGDFACGFETLAPGRSLTGGQLVILRGPVIRAVAAYSQTYGKAIRVRTYHGRPNHIVVSGVRLSGRHHLQQELTASVLPFRRHRGPMVFQTLLQCTWALGFWQTGSGGNFLDGWGRQQGTTIAMPRDRPFSGRCLGTLHWQVWAGWIGERAAHLDLRLRTS